MAHNLGHHFLTLIDKDIENIKGADVLLWWKDY